MKLVKPVLGAAGALLLTMIATMMACSSSSNDASSPTPDDDGGSSGSSGSSDGGRPDTGFLPDGAPIPITATDGIKDGDETDVDCGGSSGKACAPNEGCKIPGDCDSGVCNALKCAAPSGTDGVKNGDETDVDCGGTTTGAPKCGTDKACKVHGDCASDGCAYTGKCVAIRSCTAHHGGDTCGSSNNAADQESCCTTLDAPGAVTHAKLDKYSVTAGRFRAMVEATNGNLRGYITANKPAWWNDDWTQYLPIMLDNGGDAVDYTGLYQELGPLYHYVGGQTMATGANEGCTVKNNGARTYRLPDAINTRLQDQQNYSQDILDEKPMNCVTAFMAAAFCAWDGGYMPTRVDWDAAWGADLYPWGAAPVPAGYAIAYPNEASAVGRPPGNPTIPSATGDVHYANYYKNYWNPTNQVGTDYSVFIAEPGRFPLGKSPSGHSDMAGGVFNYQAIVAGGTAQSTNWDVQGSKSGSWQEHVTPYPNGDAASDGYITRAEYKYIALGIRCARD